MHACLGAWLASNCVCTAMSVRVCVPAFHDDGTIPRLPPTPSPPPARNSNSNKSTNRTSSFFQAGFFQNDALNMCPKAGEPALEKHLFVCRFVWHEMCFCGTVLTPIAKTSEDMSSLSMCFLISFFCSFFCSFCLSFFPSSLLTYLPTYLLTYLFTYLLARRIYIHTCMIYRYVYIDRYTHTHYLFPPTDRAHLYLCRLPVDAFYFELCPSTWIAQSGPGQLLRTLTSTTSPHG